MTVERNSPWRYGTQGFVVIPQGGTNGQGEKVALYDCGATSYPLPPFHPSEEYPEYPFGKDALGPDNPVYRTVREMLLALGLDTGASGTPRWNPLGKLVRPGDLVILKPNLVVSEHPLGLGGIQAAVAHGSVLRPLIDYTLIALKGRGRILVADSSIKEVDFQRILDLSGVLAVQEFYQGKVGIGLELLDFRDLYVVRDAQGFMMEARALPGDPAGYILVDLGSESMFHEISAHWRRLRSTAVYYENVMGEFHNPQHHIYSIPNTLLAADVVISVAKLKTHRKGGVTLSLKNAVGITNEKRALPHHRVGSPSQGGDAVADGSRWDARLEDRFRDLVLSHPSGRVALRWLGRPLRALRAGLVEPLFRLLDPKDEDPAVTEGDWHGNDTVWRMALDLNRILFCADRGGQLHPAPQRRYFSVIDGVVAGEGEGPLFPTPKECGVLLAGFHPVAVDLVGTALMGFDYKKIPMLREALARDWPLSLPEGPSGVWVITNRPHWEEILAPGGSGAKGDSFHFVPSAGWKGHIEQLS